MTIGLDNGNLLVVVFDDGIYAVAINIVYSIESGPKFANIRFLFRC